jgi:hypothetical protein
MKKFIRDLITGKSKAGQVLFGVVDILPFPNVLNIVRATLGETPNADAGHIVRSIIRKTDLLRFGVGLVLSYLFVSGKLTAENVTFLAEFLKNFMP